MCRTLKCFLEKRSTLFFSFSINILILVSTLLLFHPFFESNDDNILISIVCGAYGKYDAHMVYSNYVLGCLFVFLYQNFPMIPWYGVIYYFFMFISFSLFTKSILDHKKNTLVYVPLFLLLFCACIEGYVHPQYTKVASIVTVGGTVVFLDGLFSEKVSWKYIALGTILYLFAFMIRKLQFFATLVLFCGAVVFYAVRYYHLLLNDKNAIIQRCSVVICSFAVVFLSISTVHFIDRNAYSSSEWQKYLQYNQLRTELTDYGWPDYSENEELYKSLGIDENALYLYKNWNFYDAEKLSYEKMEQIVAAKHVVPLNIKSFFFQLFYKLPRSYVLFYIWLLIFLLLIQHRNFKTGKLFCLLISLIVLLSFYLYLFYKERWFILRVDYGLWLAFCSETLLFLCDEKIEVQNKGSLIASFCVILTIIVSLKFDSFFYISKMVTNSAPTQQADVLHKVHESSDPYFYNGLIHISSSFGAFDVIPKDIYCNTFALGGWLAHFPLVEENMEHYNFNNPYRALVENKNAILIDNGDIDSIIQYLRTWYNNGVQAELIKTFDNKESMYKILIEK